MVIKTSDEIRNDIRESFDNDKGWLSPKLWKTTAIKDKAFCAPSFQQVQEDYQKAVINIANEFEIQPEDIASLATVGARTIYDCDNMARRLRQEFHDMHYRRYRAGMHKTYYEYAAFQITIDTGTTYHDIVMISVADNCAFAFADMMQNKIWKMTTVNKPKIIGLGE